MRLPGLAVAQAAWLAREESRTRLRREAIVGVSLPGSETAGGDEPVAPDAGPEQTAVGRERLELVVAELRRCPPRAQQVFEEVYGLPGASHSEVARRLGISVQRVRQIICEVRARLRRTLESRDGPWNT